uniref:Transposase Tc1-like domain-containing protein n=1 Tax=Plectus sambesii TaxID=2011161 RepID=A0A914WZT4_9BILA
MTFKKEGKSVAAISRVILRSRHVIADFMKDPQNYGTKSSHRRPKALSTQDHRWLQRLVRKQQISASATKHTVGTPAACQTISNNLKNCFHLKRQSTTLKLPLYSQHKEAHLEFAKEHMAWTNAGNNIIFSNERKFNLDGPNGWNFYWHDLHNEPNYLSFVQEGNSTMVSKAFTSNREEKLVFINGHVNGAKYQELVENHLLPYGHIIGGSNWTLPQDNAPCHPSQSTVEWFQPTNDRVLKCPSRSLNLNTIENPWGITVPAVYANGGQFEDLHNLRGQSAELYESSWIR